MLSAAKPLYMRVLKGDKEQLGPSHPHTLDSIYNLARLYQAEGDIAQALPLFREELQGCAQLYGAEHQETKTSARNLRQLLLEIGSSEEAAKISEQFGV